MDRPDPTRPDPTSGLRLGYVHDHERGECQQQQQQHNLQNGVSPRFKQTPLGRKRRMAFSFLLQIVRDGGSCHAQGRLGVPFAGTILGGSKSKLARESDAPRARAAGRLPMPNDLSQSATQNELQVQCRMRANFGSDLRPPDPTSDLRPPTSDPDPTRSPTPTRPPTWPNTSHRLSQILLMTKFGSQTSESHLASPTVHLQQPTPRTEHQSTCHQCAHTATLSAVVGCHWLVRREVPTGVGQIWPRFGSDPRPNPTSVFQTNPSPTFDFRLPTTST